jgi:hypothetical protein
MAMLLLSGGLLNGVQTTMYALAAHVYPTPIRSTGVGLAVAVGRIGNVVAAYAASAAIDRGGPPAYFMLWSILMLFVLAALACIRRHVPSTGKSQIQIQNPRAKNVNVGIWDLGFGIWDLGFRSSRRVARRVAGANVRCIRARSLQPTIASESGLPVLDARGRFRHQRLDAGGAKHLGDFVHLVRAAFPMFEHAANHVARREAPIHTR